jgi:hypothetical protein
LSDEQKIGIVGGAALQELGKLAENSGKNSDLLLKEYPAIGAYIFWKHSPRESMPDKVKKMIAAGISYHKIAYGSAEAEDKVIDTVSLRELIPNFPSMKNAKFRKVAAIISLINTAAFTLKNKKDQENGLGEALYKKINRITGLFFRYDDFDKKEANLYWEIKKIFNRESFRINYALGN